MAKYDSLRKTDRDRALGEFADLHPTLSQKEVGKVFNISRQRVGKILKRLKRSRVEVKAT
jgi:biotin operon repressor